MEKSFAPELCRIKGDQEFDRIGLFEIKKNDAEMLMYLPDDPGVKLLDRNFLVAVDKFNFRPSIILVLNSLKRWRRDIRM